MKRLVLFVEGEGDVDAVPALVAPLVVSLPDELQGQLFTDDRAFRVGGVPQITGRPERQKSLLVHLEKAKCRPDLGAVLVVLDGDIEQVEGKLFCASDVARTLAERSREAGAGVQFSLAVVFLHQEYESLLIAVAHQLPGFDAATSLPADVERAPRDAKGWLDANLAGGYRKADQLRLTRKVNDWTPAAGLRSFRRLAKSLHQLANAVATGRHVVSPWPPVPPVPPPAD